MMERSIKDSLEALILTKGMTKDQVQVQVLAGPPKRVRRKQDYEIWKYKESDQYLMWFVFYANLYFIDDRLEKIEIGQANIPK